MIITCPECETRYTVKAEAFKAPGRKVRCKECGHEWFQPPPPEEDAAEAAPPPAPEPEPDDDADEPAIADEPGGAAADDADDAEFEEEAAEEAPKPRASDRTVRFDADDIDPPPIPPFQPQEKRRGRGAIAGWILLVLFVIVFFGSALAFRGDVARIWPATAALYRAVGLPIESPLKFRQVENEVQTENGLTVLALKGEIVNEHDRTLAVPRVRVAFRDRAGQEIYHYFFAVPEAELEPGATAEFVTRVSSPPAGASDVVLRFVEPGEYEPGDVQQAE